MVGAAGSHAPSHRLVLGRHPAASLEEHETTEPARRQSVVITAACVLLGVAVVVLRTAGHLQHPTFYAEDGTIFYSQARLLGVDAVWTPYAGYLHLVPRLLTPLAAAVPVPAAPATMVWTATVADVLLVAPVLSARLAWIVPSRTARGVLFALIMLIPEQFETLGNLANLIFVGGITVAALALSGSPRTTWGAVAELVAVAVLGLSGPIVVLLLPLFVHRVYRTRSRQSWLLLGTAAATAAIQLAIYLGSDRATAGGASGALLAKVVVERQAGAWVLGPATWQAVLSYHLVPLAVIAVWIVLVSVVALAAYRLVDMVFVLVTYVALLLAPVLAYGSMMVVPHFGDRHMVVPMMVVLTVLVGAAASARPRGWWPRIDSWIAGRALAAALILVAARGVAAEFTAQPWTVPTDTAALVACLDSPAPTCVQDISPAEGPWVVVLRGTAPR